MRRLVLLLVLSVLAACKPAPTPTPATPGASAAPALDVAELSATDARKKLESGELTSRALTQSYLDRIEKLAKEQADPYHFPTKHL